MAVLGLHGCMGFPCYVLSSCSHVWLFVTPCTIAHQLPLSMGFSRQEYWSGLPFPSPGNLPDPGIEPTSPAFARRFFTTEQLRKPCFGHTWYYFLELFSFYECLFLSLLLFNHVIFSLISWKITLTFFSPAFFYILYHFQILWLPFPLCWFGSLAFMIKPFLTWPKILVYLLILFKAELKSWLDTLGMLKWLRNLKWSVRVFFFFFL